MDTPEVSIVLVYWALVCRHIWHRLVHIHMYRLMHSTTLQVQAKVVIGKGSDMMRVGVGMIGMGNQKAPTANFTDFSLPYFDYRCKFAFTMFAWDCKIKPWLQFFISTPTRNECDKGVGSTIPLNIPFPPLNPVF